MIRVVLDTNILISALLNQQGAPGQVFLRTILDPGTKLCVSGEIFAEYEEVLRRPRFSRVESDISAALGAIRKKGFWVRPTSRVRICSDPDDDIFLDCAQAAEAHYPVTGNLKHFPSAWAGTRIVTPREFLDAVD
jgi:putative PIN family toxin of toxin-antitoxin system